MADPLAELVPLFERAIVAAFGDAYADVDPMVRPSQFADCQVNAALGLAKRLGKPPRQVAQSILEQIPTDGLVERLEIAGPGFLNVTFRAGHLADELARVFEHSGLGVSPAQPADTVVVDYSSPNVAKEMHVGHLRSTIIGDALARLLEARGHKVVRQNHLGDWGTPFGMLIEHLLDGGDEAEQHSVSDLNAFYKAAREKFDSDPAFAERARRRVVMLQSGDDETLALWRKLVDASKRYFASVYDLLGVGLGNADIAGESFYNSMLVPTIERLERAGLAVESDGAVCVFPEGFVGRDDKPLPLIIRKQDGGYGYATTDLAAIRYRIDKLGATRMLYVVGTPQAQHLGMLFKAAEMAGWLVPPLRAEHVNFGSVLGADGKMFKTRTGETVRLIDLLQEAVTRAEQIVLEKNPEMDAKQRSEIARAVGIGAVKYADLSSDRIRDYTFDYARMLAFDGNTAPYLQYAHARIRSILRKAGDTAFENTDIRIAEPQEHALALRLLAFPSVVQDVEATLQPHKLCTYLYELSTAYMTFYESCPVLKAESAEVMRSRLALSELCARIVARGLSLLGIDAPDQM
ncbi:MAG: arginine--tRNA ligase [Polyangiaceae bacterium]